MEYPLLKPRLLLTFITLFVSLFYFQQGAAMSLFFGEKNKVEAVLFSPLEGQLTFNGKPASGAKIKLWFAWKDQEGETKLFTADEDGYFSIPKQTAIYEENPLFQISIGQMVTVDFNGQEYLIWKGGKSTTHLYGELGGRPRNLTCELTKEDMDAHLEHALLETSCEWTELTKEFDK